MIAVLNTKDHIFEFSAVNKEIPTITDWRGYFFLYALKDTWVYPWKYKKVFFNIDEVSLPVNTLHIITDVDAYTKNNKLLVRPHIACDNFLNFVFVKSAKPYPVKIPARYPIASLAFCPLMPVHVYNRDKPSESI